MGNKECVGLAHLEPHLGPPESLPARRWGDPRVWGAGARGSGCPEHARVPKGTPILLGYREPAAWPRSPYVTPPHRIRVTQPHHEPLPTRTATGMGNTSPNRSLGAPCDWF